MTNIWNATTMFCRSMCVKGDLRKEARDNPISFLDALGMIQYAINYGKLTVDENGIIHLRHDRTSTSSTEFYHEGKTLVADYRVDQLIPAGTELSQTQYRALLHFLIFTSPDGQWDQKMEHRDYWTLAALTRVAVDDFADRRSITYRALQWYGLSLRQIDELSVARSRKGGLWWEWQPALQLWAESNESLVSVLQTFGVVS